MSVSIRDLAILPAILLLGACDGSPGAKAPERLWETSGFKGPESALFDSSAGVVYVSNVNGEPTGKDGNGFISKVAPDGKIVVLEWVSGLDAPKGLAQAGGKLYVSDIDQLVEIDVATGSIGNRYAAAGAKFLNDVAADAAGNVYVSDMATDTIWRLSGGKFEVWLQDNKLQNPNGLLVEDDRLIVGAWGVMTDGFATKVPGHLLTVSLADKSIAPLGDGTPVGNLDGVEPLGAGVYLVTDWMAGKVLRIDSSGKSQTLLELEQGAADLGFDPKSRTAFIPQMMKGVLYGYRIP